MMQINCLILQYAKWVIERNNNDIDNCYKMVTNMNYIENKIKTYNKKTDIEEKTHTTTG